MRRNKKIGLLIALTLSASVVALAAQPHRGRGRPGFRGRDAGPMAVLHELDLSDEQRSSIRSVLEQTRETGAQKRLMEAKRALETAVESGTADEGAVRELAYQVGVAEGDSAVERIQIRSDIRSLLTPEQSRKLDELQAEREREREERRQRFEERRERNGGREPA